MLSDIRRRFRHVLGPLIGLSAVAYFAYHTVEGDRGLLAWYRLRAQIDDAELQLAKVATEREDLEQRVRLLRPDHLDPDMLDERARAMANMAHDGDIVIFERRK
jgi:cell division protein FtsB